MRKAVRFLSANLCVTGVSEGTDDNGRYQLIKATDGKVTYTIKATGSKRIICCADMLGKTCFIKAGYQEDGDLPELEGLEETEESVTDISHESLSGKEYPEDIAAWAEGVVNGVKEMELKAILSEVSGCLRLVCGLSFKGESIGRRLYMGVSHSRPGGMSGDMYTAVCVFYHIAEAYFVMENSLVSSDEKVRDLLSIGLVAAELVMKALSKKKDDERKNLLGTANRLQQNLLTVHDTNWITRIGELR